MSNLFHKVADDESVKKEDLDPIVKSILSSLNQPDLFSKSAAGGASAGATEGVSGNDPAASGDDEIGLGTGIDGDDVMLDDVLNDILDEDDADVDADADASGSGIQQQLDNLSPGDARRRTGKEISAVRKDSIRRKRSTLGVGMGSAITASGGGGSGASSVSIGAACEAEKKAFCSTALSPLHCLGVNKERLSEKCRAYVKHSIPFRCAIEITDNHCDGLEVPVLQCLSGKASLLTPDCADVVAISKNIIAR